MSFPDHGINRKVVDDVENYLNLKFQPNVIKRLRIWLTPIFEFSEEIGPRHFSIFIMV